MLEMKKYMENKDSSYIMGRGTWKISELVLLSMGQVGRGGVASSIIYNAKIEVQYTHKAVKHLILRLKR